MLSSIRTEIRLSLYVVGLYVAFVTWGYQQEKITSSKYISEDGRKCAWSYPFVLNLFMALSASISASIIEYMSRDKLKSTVNLIEFWKAGLTSTLASPIGYASLNYIPFPLMVLTKSSKPIPVMLVGLIFYNKTYPWYKYTSVFLISGGISMFSYFSSKKHSEITMHPYILLGISLVFLNLLLDGYTNNAQDSIFEKFSVSSITMMKNTNIWQVIFIGAYVSVELLIRRDHSEIVGSYQAFTVCPNIMFDIQLFCICACVGQIMIFAVMKEFGSLVWILISIVRKLVTILISVFMFNHKVTGFQWCGVGLVFIGLILESYMSYYSKTYLNSASPKKTN